MPLTSAVVGQLIKMGFELDISSLVLGAIVSLKDCKYLNQRHIFFKFLVIGFIIYLSCIYLFQNIFSLGLENLVSYPIGCVLQLSQIKYN